MRVSSERYAPAGRAAYLLKIAVCTIPRCGFAAIAFLFLGFALLFEGCSLHREYQTARSVPFEVRASLAAEAVSLDDVLAIDGVKAATPVVGLTAELAGKDGSLSCEVLAVQGSYLTGPVQEGQCFPDRSNMPVLMVNRAAGFSCGETLQLQAGGRELTAVVCGILGDDSAEPVVRMSYETARALYPQSAGGTLLLVLEGQRGLEQALTELQKLGLLLNAQSAPMDTDTTRPFRSCFLLAGAFFVCTSSLLRERHRLELLIHKDEMIFLSHAGLDPAGWIFRLRILAAAVLCAVAASVVTAFV